MASLFFFMGSAQNQQNHRQHHKNSAKPLGGPGKLCIQRPCLILGQEGVRHAADGAGKTCTLSRLEQNNGNDTQTAKQLQNGNEQLHVKTSQCIMQSMKKSSYRKLSYHMLFLFSREKSKKEHESHEK